MTSSVALDREVRVDMVDVLDGHGAGERALLLGNVGTEGRVVSVDTRGALRWQSHVGHGSPAQILAGVRHSGEHGEVLTVGTRPDVGSEVAWWGRLAGSAGTAKFEIEGADPIRTLDLDRGDSRFELCELPLGWRPERLWTLGGIRRAPGLVGLLRSIVGSRAAVAF